MNFQTVTSIIVGIILVVSNCFAQNPEAEPTLKIVLASDVEWEKLNPARGDKSPQAGTLWGDRKANVATGFLVKFVDGFSSPPHIHNVSYRGMVINGQIHNDDPDAADMWMPSGSFWTQPQGEVHITSAKGDTNVAYIEIEEGPYLVHPPEDAFETEERPVNVDKSNIVWLNQSGTISQNDNPKVSYLWGSPQNDYLYGSLIKLPANYNGKIHSQGSTFKAVVIQGQLQYQMPNNNDLHTLEPGSLFSSQGEIVHQVNTEVSEMCIVYIRTDGDYTLDPK